MIKFPIFYSPMDITNMVSSFSEISESVRRF
jgi:hypothetical protein